MFDFSVNLNSDNSLIIEFSGDISLELTRFILGCKQSIEQSHPNGFIEAVPAYNSLLVIFNPLGWKPQQTIQSIEKSLRSTKAVGATDAKKHVIPVCYDASLAPDLEYVANKTSLSVEEVIQLHTASEYPVYMLGFLPGFLYLGGLNPKLHCARRDDPRAKVEAGSVAIGGEQTGIYPIDSPGGWNIIGKTPMRIFNITKKNPAIAKPLDTIQFTSISLDEFNSYEH
ncbi:5-oxoprolinase subunit PxpB [Kangiella japonica]|uniref:5-oxoprolinase subunit PxpB n=1 Tax=Kangiella japonica TaxID=647384 RepID=A0ABN0SUR9_9GAMM